MTCPQCKVVNPDDSQRCSACGTVWALISESETLGGDAAGVTRTSHRSPTPAWSPRSPTGSSSLPTSTGATLRPGSEFGPRYRIESVLGRGGMGEVYKAYDKELDRTVALKLVLSDRASDPEAMQRFKQELLMASKISHKNVLRIHDLGDVEGVKFISMAFVEGEDLQHALKRHEHFPLDRALKVGRQLCEALAAAHSEGVVHRDLKPQNILLDQAGQVYVSDFGLAKSFEADAPGMTRTGELLGSPRYMSPEQALGKPVDHRTDLYALGLILYEMVTGDLPFAGDTVVQTMLQRIQEKPRNPRELNPDLPDYIVRILMRCLERSPERRYQSANEILRDLDAQRTSSSLTRSVQISLTMPERPTGLLVAGAVLLLLIAALAVPSLRNLILRRPSETTVARYGIPSRDRGRYIAVLPFRVLGNDASLKYIAEGLAEAISAKLFQLKDVHIAARVATEKTDPTESLEKIGRKLGANLVARGELQGAGDKIRVIVNLDDVADGGRLWSQEFSGVSQDLLTLEDQVFAGLLTALGLQPASAETAPGAAHPTENIEAYDLYLKGRNALRNYRDTKGIGEAIGFFSDALRKDPGFALAYAGLADASVEMYAHKKDSFWAEKALSAAQQAERLNENLAEVHFSLGSVYNATGKVAESIAELKRALKLAPNSDEGYVRLGGVYLTSGRKDEAIQAFEKAIELNQYYWSNYNELGVTYFRTGDSDRALSAFRKVTELEPDNSIGYMNIGAVYFRQGKYNECIPFFQRALQLQPQADLYSNLGTAYFFLKRYDESVRMFEKAVAMNPNDQENMGNLADAYRWSGHADQARSTYDKAIGLAYKDLQVNPRKAGTMGDLALYYAKKDNSTQALQFIRRARSIDPNNIQFIYDEAQVKALANRPDEALKALKDAFQKGYSPEEAKSDPELKSLQNRPEFVKLIAEFGGGKP